MEGAGSCSRLLLNERRRWRRALRERTCQRISSLNTSASLPASPSFDAEVGEPAQSVWTHVSGLSIVHRRLTTAPVVAVQVWIGVGAADETDAQHGIAHVHEHLVFKGTAKRGVGRIASDIESAGGSINAWTSLEETVYHVVMPSEDAALGVDVLLDGVLRAAFDADELARELEVIREEIRRGDDVPSRSHMEGILAAAWPEHPYGKRVIGTIESVSAFGRDDLVAFSSQWYDLGNMTLVVAGDCEKDAVDAWVTETLAGKVSRGFVRPTRTGKRPAQNVTPIVEYREVENARVTLVFPGPSVDHPDAPILDVLTTYLAGTNSSQLYDRLVRQDELALGTWSDGMYLQDAGLLFAGAAFAPDVSVHHIIRVLAEELSRIGEKLREGDLRRAVRAFESANLNSQVTVQGLAQSIGSGALHMKQADWQERWMDRVRDVRVDDLRRVAKTWLRSDHAIVSVQLPLSMKDTELRPSSLLDALDDGFTKQRHRAKSSSTPDHDGFERMVLDNGMVLLAQVDRTLPIFSASMGTTVGTLADPEPLAGRTSMMAGLLNCGNQLLDTALLEREMDVLGCDASASAGQQTSVFSLTGLTDEQRGTFDLAHACWFLSNFPEDEVARSKRVRTRGLIQQAENPSYLAARAMNNAFFADHRYAIPGSGVVETVEALTRADLVDAHRYLLDPSRMVLSVSGDVDLDQLVDQLSRWDVRDDVVRPSMDVVVPTRPLRQEIIVEHARKQAVVMLAYPGLARDDAGSATLSVLTSILSGQGGRLFNTLREERSLAYSVSVGADSREKAGIFYGVIETSPGKIDEAISGMREELQRLIDEPLTDAEVDRAKARIAGQMKVALQRGSSRASVTMRDELLGRGYRYGLDFSEQVRAVDAASLRSMAERLIVPAEEVVVVSRPKDV